MKRHILTRTCPRGIVHSFGKFPMRHGSVASIKPTVENRSEIDFQENIFRQNVINDLQKVTHRINSFGMTSGMSSLSDHLSYHHFFRQSSLIRVVHSCYYFQFALPIFEAVKIKIRPSPFELITS